MNQVVEEIDVAALQRQLYRNNSSLSQGTARLKALSVHSRSTNPKQSTSMTLHNKEIFILYIYVHVYVYIIMYVCVCVCMQEISFSSKSEFHKV